jgi:hypothetical protein
MHSFARSRVVAGTLFALVLLSLLAFTACGSKSSIQANLNPTTGSTVQISIGDGPSDRVAALSITINSLSLTNDAGTVVPVISAPVTVEMTHLAGTTQPVATLTIPAGTYTQATISLGTTAVTLVDPAAGTTSQKTLPAPPAITLTLSPPLVISGSPLVLNIDLNLAASLAMDAAGNISFNPRFLVSHGPMAGPGTTPNPFNGGVDRTIGVVTSVSSATFTIKPAFAGSQSMTFVTNSSTRFLNVSGISQITAGMLVGVAAQTQSDGTLLATVVGVLNAMNNGIGVIGQVVTVTGSPATQLQLLGHGTMGPMPALPSPWVGITVNVSSATAFHFDSDGFDFSGLGWIPSFSASSIKPAQFVEVDTTVPAVTGGGMMMGAATAATLSAAEVELEPQPLIGTVSGFSGGNSFTLTVSPDSVFATIAKTTTITVYTQAKTALTNLSAISNGSIVVVRGLLFVDGGTYKMVAGRIAATP